MVFPARQDLVHAHSKSEVINLVPKPIWVTWVRPSPSDRDRFDRAKNLCSNAIKLPVAAPSSHAVLREQNERISTQSVNARFLANSPGEDYLE